MKVERIPVYLKPDPKRVLLRSFRPASKEQLVNIISRILDLTEDKAENEFKTITRKFSDRHRNINETFLKRFREVLGYIDNDLKASETKKLLICASLSMEYSVESAALFNPSIVFHPDQSNLPERSKRFILSLRATGEGHISSIVFRTGVLASENKITIEEPGRIVSPPQKVISAKYDKKIIDEAHPSTNSEYEIDYDESQPLFERIIFPYSPAESNGIEDARFVQFQNEDGSITYYATYTAYNGKQIQSQLLETKDFLHFKINKLSGSEAKNKGMALFPRKINGQFIMLSRQDNENNYIMFSDDLYCWNSKKLLAKPAFNWEAVQVGNCGSPIETDKGWLVLTHGVGPIRKYSIGVMLLDLDDPTKVIGRLKEPLISPNENEREGYVPNVVYSCGGLINNDELIIPYAMSDSTSSFAKVNLQNLLNELISN